MLKMTLLATTAIGAALFAIAAVLPAIAKSRGGDAASPPAASAQTLAQAPTQNMRQENDGGRLWKAERRQDKRDEDRHDAGRRKDDDRSHD
jgi:hypothetical protein